MQRINRQFELASRPVGEPVADHFRLVEKPVPTLQDGQVLVQHRFLSLDPYMRGRMSDRRSYAAPQALDAVMLGGTAGEVIESSSERFSVGDQVVGMGGWQEYSVVDVTAPGALHRVDTTHIPLAAYLGVVGMPGVTAWFGLNDIIRPVAGETVIVSAASGPVGGTVGQLAKAKGCRAVGIAGGPEKCAYVVDELGFDACIDYKAHRDLRSLLDALKVACPDGIDGNFENVGGQILDAIMLRMNAFGRIAICGLIAGYNGEPIPMANPGLLLASRLTVRGFIVADHLDRWPPALQELGGMVAAGTLRYRESIAEGLESAPDAFIGQLKGHNFGKQLVRIS